MPKINVKCGSKMLNVDVDLNDSPMLLKAQLFGLTEIPPDRQKLLIKGKTIGDESWEGIMIKEGSTIMLVGGTASVNVHSNNENKDGSGSPTKPVKSKEVLLPVGLKNLGNTCYMNATLQCFKIIPELDAAIKKYSSMMNLNASAGNPAERSRMITTMLKKLYEDMDKKSASNANSSENSDSAQSAMPLLFLHVLHQTLPQFATQDERGNYQQQDANECFCEVLRLITEEMKYAPAIKDEGPKVDEIPLRKFFEIGYEVTTKCKEEGGEKSEKSVKSEESQFQLNCYLTQEVRYIQSGIKSKMVEEIEKQSTALGRNAIYEKHSLISRLPAYLSVQIVRFYYKDKENINAKILKDVKFPIILDIFDMCTPELQEKLKPARQALKDYDDMKVELQRKAKLAEHGEKAVDIKPKGYFPNAFSDDLGSNNSGIYELKALITHKGRASNSGHYVAWVRVADEDDCIGVDKQQSSGNGAKWAACDDDNVYPVTEEEILKLSGGGDWHCAYVLLYGPKKIPKLADSE